MQMMVSVSSQAWKNGSQKRSLSQSEGRPSGAGLSVNETAWLPLSAQRRISAAASSASQRGTMVRGMRRPRPSPAVHSSMFQSLYAWTLARPSSRSGCSMKVWPQKRGRVLGKQTAASMRSRSMSASRSFCFQAPGRTSSNVVNCIESESKPTAADNIMRGATSWS